MFTRNKFQQLVLCVMFTGLLICMNAFAQTQEQAPKNEMSPKRPIGMNGVFPNLTVYADGVGSNSEAGIGALIPWANKLWAIGYVAHIKGEGLGLYEISEDMTMRKHPASVTGTFTSRMAHWPSKQATTGRGDGENYQIGFVDICDTPYPETIRASREVGYDMYEYRFKH